MKKIALIFAASLALASCTDAPGAQRTLENNGYTDVTITGYDIFACDGKSDNFSTGFKAVSPSGHVVKGTVCKGWLKGSTIRFDD